jgi:hypothetical protein
MPSSADFPLSIGVLHPEAQRAAVLEFFELFKAPWATYDDSRPASFGAVIAGSQATALPTCPIVFVHGPHESPVDRALNLVRSPLSATSLLEYRGDTFPLYTDAVAFDGPADGMGLQTADGRRVGVIVRRPENTIVRIGYDLFAEVDQLLSAGHPSGEHAALPTTELHIEIIRSTLVALGMPVVEIPPRPLGHPFIVCLTHDIDFMGIRHHRLDRSVAGFVVRVFRSLLAARSSGWRKVRKNFGALLSLPGVYLKRQPDFWYPLDRYREAEGRLPSTYFFIPYADRPGKSDDGAPAPLRAARYRVEEYTEDLRGLEGADREVGVHGIDAWCDPEHGKAERAVIRDITGREDLGIRMHWLYFADRSPSILEQAGYTYDSTLGFNSAVGYRNGTTQVFRPRGASTLLELPLNVQDTALLFPSRMHLSEVTALERCAELIDTTERFGGVLTINWHDRSLAPERNWDDVYRELLIRLQSRAPWFARARDAVAWFRRRRALAFTGATTNGSTITVTLTDTQRALAGWTDDLPPPVIRILTAGGRSTEMALNVSATPSAGVHRFEVDLGPGFTADRSRQ